MASARVLAAATTPSRPSAAAAGAAASKPKRPPNYNSNKARQERREEIVRLRRSAVELEHELDHLKSKRTRLSTPTGSTSHTMGAPDVAETLMSMQRPSWVWEEIAGHQWRERRRAERENAQLKAVLEAQIKIAKSLETILNKRFAMRSMDGFFSDRRRRTFANSSDAADTILFEELLLRVEGCYLEVERLFDALGVGSLEVARRDARMQHGENGIYLEVFANNVLPFSVHQAGKAAWQYFANNINYLPFRQYYERIREEKMLTDDTIVENLGLELHANNTKALFRLKQVLRRYVEHDRVVIVWTAIIDPIEFDGKPFSGYYFRENGYLLLKRANTCDPASHCVLKTCYIITPEFSSGSTLSEDDDIVNELTDFALSGADASVATAHQVIENMLLANAFAPEPQPMLSRASEQQLQWRESARGYY